MVLSDPYLVGWFSGLNLRSANRMAVSKNGLKFETNQELKAVFTPIKGIRVDLNKGGFGDSPFA